MGRTVEEKVAMATAWGVFRDTHIQFVGLCYGHHGFPTFEAARENFPKQIRPYIAKLNGLLGEKEFMAGEITWVDFGIADFLQALGLFTPDLLTEFPKLKAYQERVWSLPQLKGYFSSRFQERPINNYSALWK
jgi:glutathione S-transferase